MEDEIVQTKIANFECRGNVQSPNQETQTHIDIKKKKEKKRIKTDKKSQLTKINNQSSILVYRSGK